MNLVAGLDPSLRSTGLVVLKRDGKVEYADTISRGVGPQGVKGFRRIVGIACEVRLIMDDCALVVIEGYAYGAREVAPLAELGGVVKYFLFDEEISFITVPPSRVKKFVCRGNAKKDEMRLAVYKRWAFENSSNDVVDAYALAQLGRAVLGWEDKLTKAQIEVVEAVKKSMEVE